MRAGYLVRGGGSTRSRPRSRLHVPSECGGSPVRGYAHRFVTWYCILTLLVLVCGSMLSEDDARLLRETSQYLTDVLGTTFSMTGSMFEDRLPLYLRQRYTVLTGSLSGRSLVWALNATTTDDPPSAVAKQIRRIESVAGCPAILVRNAMASYERDRLIKQRVSFLVPGNQLYLLPLGIDLRERFKRRESRPDHMGRATQLLVLSALLGQLGPVLTQGACAKRLGYSTMTMSRSFSEIESLGISTLERGKGRRTVNLPEDRLRLWRSALPYLQSPVIERVITTRPPAQCLVAGQSALASATMLAAPSHPVVAIYSAEARRRMTAGNLAPVGGHHEATLEVELWWYDPRLLSERREVDPLSLYLSLRDSTDDRVQTALDELLRSQTWYTD